MNVEFSFEMKKKLVERIQKIASYDTLHKIKQIIFDANPHILHTQNNNGIFLKFEKLTNETYEELTLFLDKIDHKKLKQMENEVLETSEANDVVISEHSENVVKKLRLTNTETHILNRVKYEKALRENAMDKDINLPIFECKTIKTKFIKN